MLLNWIDKDDVCKKRQNTEFYYVNMIFHVIMVLAERKHKALIYTFFKLMRKLILQIKENGGISYLSLESITLIPPICSRGVLLTMSYQGEPG